MTLKAQINKDFLEAYKAKDEKKKNALGMLKSKITEAEKLKKNVELDDVETLRVIISSAKQRNQSIEEYSKAGRTDLVEAEREELRALEVYLPKQMNEAELREKVNEILSEITATNRNQKVGMATGAMNKKFPGQFDPKELVKILSEVE